MFSVLKFPPNWSYQHISPSHSSVPTRICTELTVIYTASPSFTEGNALPFCNALIKSRIRFGQSEVARVKSSTKFELSYPFPPRVKLSHKLSPISTLQLCSLLSYLLLSSFSMHSDLLRARYWWNRRGSKTLVLSPRNGGCPSGRQEVPLLSSSSYQWTPSNTCYFGIPISLGQFPSLFTNDEFTPRSM